MEKKPLQPTILVIGNDERLTYLLGRYAEQSGCQTVQRSTVPWAGEIRQLKPAAIIFSSLEHLQVAQSLIEDLAGHDVLVLACVALADEARAREYGADACLVHPLTFEGFLTTLSTVCPAGDN